MHLKHVQHLLLAYIVHWGMCQKWIEKRGDLSRVSWFNLHHQSILTSDQCLDNLVVYMSGKGLWGLRTDFLTANLMSCWRFTWDVSRLAGGPPIVVLICDSYWPLSNESKILQSVSRQKVVCMTSNDYGLPHLTDLTILLMYNQCQSDVDLTLRVCLLKVDRLLDCVPFSSERYQLVRSRRTG